MNREAAPDRFERDEVFLGQVAPLLDGLAARLREHLADASAAVRLTPQLALALRRLRPDEPRPMRELAGALGCDPSNVTGIADRLESLGLVVRRVAAHDRRVTELAVTARGAEVRDRFLRHLQRVPLRVDALAAEERELLLDLLRRLLGEEPGCAGGGGPPPCAAATGRAARSGIDGSGRAKGAGG